MTKSIGAHVGIASGHITDLVAALDAGDYSRIETILNEGVSEANPNAAITSLRAALGVEIDGEKEGWDRDIPTWLILMAGKLIAAWEVALHHATYGNRPAVAHTIAEMARYAEVQKPVSQRWKASDLLYALTRAVDNLSRWATELEPIADRAESDSTQDNRRALKNAVIAPLLPNGVVQAAVRALNEATAFPEARLLVSADLVQVVGRVHGAVQSARALAESTAPTWTIIVVVRQIQSLARDLPAPTEDQITDQ